VKGILFQAPEQLNIRLSAFKGEQYHGKLFFLKQRLAVSTPWVVAISILPLSVVVG
jgi:hypothetical protein